MKPTYLWPCNKICTYQLDVDCMENHLTWNTGISCMCARCGNHGNFLDGPHKHCMECHVHHTQPVVEVEAFPFDISDTIWYRWCLYSIVVAVNGPRTSRKWDMSETAGKVVVLFYVHGNQICSSTYCNMTSRNCCRICETMLAKLLTSLLLEVEKSPEKECLMPHKPCPLW